ncbi:tRNA dihydrouridine synthase [Neonectria punicea]|uniref:tRNA dihydrouridine synthase n=1 Tax=Neonectria punicea TaxID=979145 RepID=A0ABR1HIL9_9HYPO
MSICGEGESAHPLKIFDVTRKQDRFLYALAPMVRYGKLAFRQTVHKYGVDLCWTPMMLAKEFNRNSFARDSGTSFFPSPPPPNFTVSTNPDQPATIVQFGANVPLELARAAALVAPRANGVDLNCGCPQSWACAEKLGAALMGHRELVRDMVVETRQRLKQDGWHVGLERDIESPKGRSVSVKIRIHDDLRKTMDFLDTVIGDPQNRLVDWVTIHPRTKSTPSTTPIRTEALEILIAKYAGTLPILLSGDIFDINSLPLQPTITTNDAPHTSLATLTLNSSLDTVTTAYSKPTPSPSNTNLSGFMSARGLLANPALFAGHSACPWEAVETFMCNVTRCPLPFKLTLHHLQEMCGPGMSTDKSSLLTKKERAEMTGLANMCELIDYLDDMIEEKTGRVGGLRRDL